MHKTVNVSTMSTTTAKQTNNAQHFGLGVQHWGLGDLENLQLPPAFTVVTTHN